MTLDLACPKLKCQWIKVAVNEASSKINWNGLEAWLHLRWARGVTYGLTWEETSDSW